MLSVRMRPEGTPRKDRRASKACSGCRTRKVRCDVLTSGIPCSNCKADQFECSILPRKKRTTKSTRQREGNWGALNATISDDPGSHAVVAPAGYITQHIARHQIPHYPLLRGFTEGNDGDEPASAERQASLGAATTLTTARQILPSLSPEDLQYLTLKGALDVPPKQVLNDLVSNYFRVFHPFFPIVDKRTFLQQYDAATSQDRFNQHAISLLLLQSIIFTSCASIDASVISSMKFTSRKQARAIFHSRARCLYEFDYENDSIVSVQALLLMSHHYPSMTDQKHTWFWAQQAIGLAQGAGLHRDPGPVSQRKHWARIWWTCLSRDRLIAIGTGRPMHINSLDCDVPMLTLDDLAEDGDDDDVLATKTAFIELIKLCQYMECILPLHITKSISDKSLEEQVEICEETLQRWLDHLPVVAQLDQPIKSSPGLIFPIYRAVLHMIYNIVVIALHQSHQAAPNYTPSESRLPHPKVQVAAQNITELAERLMELDVVKLCPTICVTSILSSLIVHLLMQHFSLGKENSTSGTGFGICLNYISELSDIYWHAGFYHDLFKLAFKTHGNRTTPLLDNDKHSVLAFLQETTKNGKAAKQPRLAAPETSTGDADVDDAQPHSQPTATSTAYEPMAAVATDVAPNQEVSDKYAVDFSSEFEYPSLDNSNIDSALFEDWLNECGYYYNSLPSA